MADFATFALLVAAMAFKPGPGAAIHAARALRDGWAAGLTMAAGTDCGHIALFAAVTLILAFAASAVTGWFPYLLGIAGGAYYLWRSGRSLILDMGGTGQAAAPRRRGLAFIDGLLWAPANYVNLAFYLAVLPNYLDFTDLAGPIWLGYAGILVVIMFAAQVFYMGLARTGYALMVLAGERAGLDTGRLAWRMRVGMTLVLGTVALILIGQSAWALWAAVQGRG